MHHRAHFEPASPTRTVTVPLSGMCLAVQQQRRRCFPRVGRSGDKSRSFSEWGSELAVVSEDVIDDKLAFSDEFRKRFPGPEFTGVRILNSEEHGMAMTKEQKAQHSSSTHAAIGQTGISMASRR